MQDEPQIIVSYSVRSNASDRTIGVIEVTRVPTDGVYVKPPQQPAPFKLINEIKPFSHMGLSPLGQGTIYDLTVTPGVPIGKRTP